MVAYNAPDHIAACLQRIADTAAGLPHEVLLVDNGDGSAEQIARRDFPHVRIVTSQGNIGYGAGNNLLARDATGDILLIINPDAFLAENSLHELTRAIRSNQQVAAFAANLVENDGSPSPENRILQPGLWQTFLLALGLWKASPPSPPQQDSALSPITAASGACFAIRKDWWDRLGGFDEKFFLYFEEVDLWLRLAKQGGMLTRVPHFIVAHDTGTGQRHSITRRQAYLRGYMTYCRKHFGPVGTWLCGAAIWLFALRTSLIEHGIEGISATMPRHWWRGWT